MGTETDVLGANVPNLFRDANATLNEGMRHGTIRTEHEKSRYSGKRRTDVSWAFYPSQGGRRVFAVLELKTRSNLTWDNFIRGQKRRRGEDMLRRTKGSCHKTMLARNAKCCIKQIAKYAGNLRTKDVAVFDWNCFFYRKSPGPDLARGIWYKEERNEHFMSDTFHTILLGILFRAISRYPHIR